MAHRKQIVTTTTYRNGVPHSIDDNPASVTVDVASGKWSLKQWFFYGKLHRDDDKHAVEWDDGSKFWYKHGVMHRDGDLPANDEPGRARRWYKNGLMHRDNDLPAFEWYPSGMKQWYQHGVLHRDGDKPAIEHGNGKKLWYKHGELIAGDEATYRILMNLRQLRQ